MTRIHEKLQNSTAKFARTEWELFQPERWMPHITLLPADIALDKLLCVFEQLIYEDFHWKFQIDNFEVFQQNDDQSIMDIARFEFGG